jgi:hypothetical protein
MVAVKVQLMLSKVEVIIKMELIIKVAAITLRAAS